MANSLMSKLLKVAGKDNKVSILSSSGFFDKDVVYQSRVPLINLLLAGDLDSGPKPGIVMLVGDSRTFKTNFCLENMKNFLDTHEDGIALFFDSEFGAKTSFESFGIDKNRVIHYALENIEDLKFKCAQALEAIDSGEKVFIFIDSISQIASKKEAENALNENSAADLTRARELNSFFRIITPKLMIKKIPCFVINSYYDDMGNPYAEPIIKGGKQAFLSADIILLVSRSQIKDEDKSLAGFTFTYKAHKHRFVKEGSKFPVTVTFDGGIDVNSGLFDLAMESGFLRSEKQGYYLYNLDGFINGTQYRRKQVEANQPFFDKLVKNKDFKQYLVNKYKLEAGEMFKEEDVEETVDSDGVINHFSEE